MSLFVVVVVVLGASLLALSEWRLLGWNRQFAIRFVWIAALGFICLELNRTVSRSWSEPQPLTVVVDRSDSVAKVDSRRQHYEDIVTSIKSLATENQTTLQMLSFGSDLKFESDSIVWGDEETRADSLKNFLNEEGSSQVLLLSDGRWRGILNARRPVNIIEWDESNEKDIWIQPQQAKVTAFLKNKVSLQGIVGQKGYGGSFVKVRLFRGLSLVEEKSLRLSSEETPIEFSFFPDRMGQETVTLVVVPETDELTQQNNQTWISVRTVRDKIRLLHVCGRPSLDLKAWRLFFTRQPDIDLVSFYILRSLDDNPEARDYELSLIPFPYDDLFTKELDKFDVIVLQNFDFTQYFQSFYLDNLRRYIESGGSLLMIGGDSSFQHYLDSPLQTVLPFRMDLGRSAFEMRHDTVESVSDHPVVDRLRDGLLGFDFSGRHQLLEPHKANAETLIRLKSGIPWLMIQQAERGRVVAINSDESWKLQADTSSRNISFFRLARSVLQYLTFDPEVEKGAWRSTRWTTKESIVLDSQKGEKIAWRIEALSPLSPWTLEFNAEKRVELRVPGPGVYRVTNKANSFYVDYETEERPWLNEWLEVTTNHKALKDLALQSRGQIVSSSDLDTVSFDTLSGRQILDEESLLWMDERPLWGWLGGLLILLLICSDWWLRFRRQWD